MSIPFLELAPEMRAAVDAYDAARRSLANSFTITGPGEPAMSDANKATIAPMIRAAVLAYGAALYCADWSDLESDVADVISDSMDMDWTSRDGARAVVAYLKNVGARIP